MATIAEVPIIADEATALAQTLMGDPSMTTQEERLTILRMVEQGKISAEDAARLLAALGDQQAPPRASTPPPAGDPFDTSRSLSVRVTDMVTGQPKVTVNLPLGLVRFGLRFVPKSANVDVASIQQAIDTGIRGKIVDVVDDEGRKHVEIFVD
jgi:hypothetical protein